MGKIFVNYRRDDERAMAARVRDRLAQTFGDRNVFMDVDHLMAGQRFDHELEKALAETDVFLAVIGSRWMELLEERQSLGERDYVHEEISGALKAGITVIPVLIDGAILPRADMIPDDLHDLILHQKHDVAYERFGRDVESLAEAINFARKRHLEGQRPKRDVSKSALLASVLFMAAIGGTASFYFYWPRLQLQWNVAEERAKKEPKTKAEASPNHQETDNEAVKTDEASMSKARLKRRAKERSVANTKAERDPATIDGNLQKSVLWRTLKVEYPDWYEKRVSEISGLAESVNETELAKHLLEKLVKLRRAHANDALVSSGDSLRNVASAFSAALKKLQSHSIDACYSFISQGELSPTAISLFPKPGYGDVIEAHLTAIFGAIADGRKSPIKRQRADKSDYEILSKKLKKIGWDDTDLALFSDPVKLNKAPPARACSMVQDWFAAHLAIEDSAIQQRLLAEMLRPVVAG